MDGLSQLIVNGNPTALNLVKTLLDAPMLINPSITKDGLSQGAPFAIPLETETHQQTGNAEVSESLLITAGGKKNVADNVAPGSWTWNLTGYIPGNAALEPTNLYTPFVALNSWLIRNAYQQGYVLIYKDIDAQIYRRVVIKSLTINTKSDCRNKTPFSMTLKEINVMDDFLSNMTQSAKAAQPKSGSNIGYTAAVGTVVATKATVDVIKAVISGGYAA